MIDQSFRARHQSISKPVTAVYGFFSLTPNHVTILSFIFGIFAAFAVATAHTTAALFLWWVSRFFDGTDGLCARHTGRTTQFGAYLDIVLDMAAYSLMILGFAHLYPALLFFWLVIIFLYVLCITSALALGTLERKAGIGPNDNRGLKLASGLAEGGETSLMYTAFILFPSAIQWLAIFWIVVLVVTVVSRTVIASKELSS